MRRCLAEEFSSIYVFHLRGNARTSGEIRRKEKDNVFGVGSRAPIAVSILVKNPDAQRVGEIYYHDIGDYLSKEEKLAKIRDLGSIHGITEIGGWQQITPDDHGDWFKQRDTDFNAYIAMGDKKGQHAHLFKTFSNGVKSNRDPWVFNASKSRLRENVNRMTSFFNEEAQRLAASKQDGGVIDVDSFIKVDRSQISWADDLKRSLAAGRTLSVDAAAFVPSHYRPFTKQWLYMDRRYLWSLYLMPQMLPRGGIDNRVICISSPGNKGAFSVLMTDIVPSLHMADMAGCQCFPLYVFDSEVEEASGQQSLILDEESKTTTVKRHDGISDEGLTHFQSAYPGETITKEDIFYYVYGLLHSPDYCERFSDNLGKELPRIPCVKKSADFWSFSHAGRSLADLHLKYESVEPYPLKIDSAGKKLTDSEYRVEKMRYGKKGKDKDLTTLHYNDRITLTGIPLDAYDYIVNGKPALDWVVERQGLKTDKDTGIINDANDWAVETVGDPRYPLKLFQRVITVSLQTMKIVRELPRLDIALAA